MFFLLKFFIYSGLIKLGRIFLLQNHSDQQNLLLLKENQILRRKLKKVRFTNNDRLFYVALLRTIPSALEKMILLKPQTILKWHKKLVNNKWDYSDRRKMDMALR